MQDIVVSTEVVEDQLPELNNLISQKSYSKCESTWKRVLAVMHL